MGVQKGLKIQCTVREEKLVVVMYDSARCKSALLGFVYPLSNGGEVPQYSVTRAQMGGHFASEHVHI